MLPSTSSLLEHPEALRHPTQAPGISNGIELALFRARGAMLDGWNFTPESVRAYSKPCSWQEDSQLSRDCLATEEDEVEETALYFSE